MKLWGGRFKDKPAKAAQEFTSSIYFDNRLAKIDCIGSIAHVKMLGKCNIIPQNQAKDIIKALSAILKEIVTGKFKTDVSCEDIHTNIEKEVIKRAGEAGKKMHTARSRNDQIALDERLYLREEILSIIKKIQSVKSSLKLFGKRYKNLVIPGFTHMQHAQPVKFIDYIDAYSVMLERDIERFKEANKRVNVMPLGAGALAGTSLPIDRNYVANLLGFPKVTKNNIDAVSDRDYIIEFASVCAILFVHLSRLSEEMVIWVTKEFGYIEIADSFTTGSSIMPQKKNPDIFELIRGKTGRIFGGLMGLLTIMKGLPLAYNSDMQEDKVHLFSIIDTTKDTLNILTELIKNIKLKVQNIKKAMDKDYSDATELANYLVSKGLSFRDAHAITGKIVLYCMEEDVDLKDLPLGKYRIFSNIFDNDVYKVLKVRC